MWRKNKNNEIIKWGKKKESKSGLSGSDIKKKKKRKKERKKEKENLNIVGKNEHNETKSEGELSNWRLFSEIEIWKFDKLLFPKITPPLASNTTWNSTPLCLFLEGLLK